MEDNINTNSSVISITEYGSGILSSTERSMNIVINQQTIELNIEDGKYKLIIDNIINENGDYIFRRYNNYVWDFENETVNINVNNGIATIEEQTINTSNVFNYSSALEYTSLGIAVLIDRLYKVN